MKELTIKAFITDLCRDEHGQDLIEYALVVALIALGTVAGTKGLATAINAAFSRVGSKLGTYVS